MFFERDPAVAFYAVVTGAVKLFRLRPDGREQVIHALGPGTTFAEAAVLNLGVYPVHAVATETPTELIIIPGEPVKKLIREDERVATAMIGSLSMRLLELVERTEELASASAAEWEARLNQAGVPAGRVLSVPQVLEEPQVIERRMTARFEDVPGADRPVTVSRGGFLVDGEAPHPGRPPPRLGEHTDEVLGKR